MTKQTNKQKNVIFVYMRCIIATWCVGMKTLPAVFSRRHHGVLERSVRAAQSTVNVSGSALHRGHQPGPAHARRFHARLLLSSQNQVAELLGLRHVVLDRKEFFFVKA